MDVFNPTNIFWRGRSPSTPIKKFLKKKIENFLLPKPTSADGKKFGVGDLVPKTLAPPLPPLKKKEVGAYGWEPDGAKNKFIFQFLEFKWTLITYAYTM